MYANSIDLMQGYPGLLDEAYAAASLTAALDTRGIDALSGARANELIIPQMTLSGLANYDRDNGYAPGAVSLANQTVVCNYDRGRMFQVDVLDDEQTACLAFGRLAGEFIRTRVTPELDAFRFSAYAEAAGGAASAALETGEEVLAAIRAACGALDNAQVSMHSRYLFIASNLLGMVEDLDTTVSRAALNRFDAVVRVHSAVFYKGIKMNDGTSSGQTDGGFTVDDDSVPLNFLAVQKDAVIQHTHHVQPKVIAPADNQQADAWKFGYRVVSLACALPGRAGGIYAHLAEQLED
jgi:hypothetical protein